MLGGDDGSGGVGGEEGCGGAVAAVKHGRAEWGGSLDRKGGGLIPSTLSVSLSFLFFPFSFSLFSPPSSISALPFR